VARLADVDLSPVRYYWFREGKALGAPTIFARTG
jgi:hypothetical protein